MTEVWREEDSVSQGEGIRGLPELWVTWAQAVTVEA